LIFIEYTYGALHIILFVDLLVHHTGIFVQININFFEIASAQNSPSIFFTKAKMNTAVESKVKI